MPSLQFYATVNVIVIVFLTLRKLSIICNKLKIEQYILYIKKIRTFQEIRGFLVE